MLVAVDGTGAWSDDDYKKDMSNSFVSQIYNQYSASRPDGHYRRGPTLLGFETGPIAHEFSGLILKTYERYKKAGKAADFELYLTGYSRGGAAVIATAYLLSQSRYREEIKVKVMALFDAVDRSPVMTADTIPGNVELCFHALRDPNAGSRTYFGNCGLAIQNPGKMEKRVFFATHAALGGVPWTGDHPTKAVVNPKFNLGEYVRTHPLGPPPPPSMTTIEVPKITQAQDEAGAKEVQKWMWDNMKKHGML
jgi:hypothetical protein